MARSFLAALMASVVVRLANPFGTYQTPLFYVNYTLHWSFMEMIPFILLGIFGALLGCLFIVLNLKWCRFRNSSWLGKHPIAEVLIVTLITATISYHNPYTRRSSTVLISQMFDRCGNDNTTVKLNICDYVNKTSSSGTSMLTDANYGHTGAPGPNMYSALWQLGLALCCKLLFTIFTFGMKIPAGLFIPSIAMGSIAGRILGVGMEQLMLTLQENSPFLRDYCQVGVDCVMPGLYAMVGAAAVLVGVTRMTVSLVVIMFELTGSLDFVVPAMVTVLVANWVGEAICKRGIYDAHIHQNGYPFLDAREKFESTTIAKDVMHPRPNGTPLRVVSRDTVTITDIENLLEDTHYNGYPVVDNEMSNMLVGFVERTDLELLIKHVHQVQKDSNIDNQSAQSTINSSASNASSDSAFNDLTLYSTITSEASNRQLFRNRSLLQIPKKFIDTTPLIIDEITPMEKVVDMFIKLGARHILVAKNGRLLGIVTRKDTMLHVKELEEEEEREKKEGKSHHEEHEQIQIISQNKMDEAITEIDYVRL